MRLILNPWRENARLRDAVAKARKDIHGWAVDLDRLEKAYAALRSEKDGAKYLEGLLADERAKVATLETALFDAQGQVARFDGNKDGKTGGGPKGGFPKKAKAA